MPDPASQDTHFLLISEPVSVTGPDTVYDQISVPVQDAWLVIDPFGGTATDPFEVTHEQ